MEKIVIYNNISFNNPTMIAGWPGMGSVAMGVVDYLRKRLKAVRFAEIKLDPIVTLDSMYVDDGFAKFPPSPKNIFYYVKDPELIIFEGEAQVAGQAGINLLKTVLDLALKFKVSRMYTGAAFPMPVSYKEQPEVYFAVNKKPLGDIIKRFGIHPMEGGHISGLNGLALGFAQEKGIEAICLLATMPQYAISLPNPKASAAILDVMRKILGLNMSLNEMDGFIKDMEEKMSLIEDKVKDVLVIEKEDIKSRHSEKKIPEYIMQKIEKLFEDTKADRTKAAILKKELDRWDLYKFYEDRFLDLFKDIK